MKIVREDISSKFMLNILKHFMNFKMMLRFLPERGKIGKFEELVAILRDKEENFVHTRNIKQPLNR